MDDVAEGADAPAGKPDRRRERRVLAAALALLGLGILAVPALVVIGHLLGGREVPAFPSLADAPDPTLHGTVAYVDDATGCVRVASASGRPSKEVACLPPLDPASAASLGKPIGPQLVWRSGGILEITMFRMTDPPGPNVRPGWQKLVDVRTGTVTDLPDASAPSTPDLTARTHVRADGARLTTSSDAESGRVTITLTDADGRSRKLLDVHGPGEYSYGLAAAFWSPDGDYVVADDGRILVIRPSDPPVVRLLLAPVTRLGGDPALARVAVTAEDLLAP